MQIYIIRHGETDANVEGRLQGRTNNDLNHNGVKLTTITGKAMNGIHFDGAFTSPLMRAQHTASIILEESGNPDMDMIIDERLVEVSMGDWENKRFKGPDIELPPGTGVRVFGDIKPDFRFPGGETPGEVMSRTQSFLRELAARNDDKTYLVSTHGFATRAMLNFLYEDKSDFWHGHVPYNCAVNIVEVRGGKIKLIADDKLYYERDKAIDLYKL